MVEGVAVSMRGAAAHPYSQGELCPKVNRYLDRDVDAVNPRTQVREIPAGLISARSALLFVLANCALFILTTWFLNRLCFFLSPVALAVVLGLLAAFFLLLHRGHNVGGNLKRANEIEIEI